MIEIRSFVLIVALAFLFAACEPDDTLPEQPPVPAAQETVSQQPEQIAPDPDVSVQNTTTAWADENSPGAIILGDLSCDSDLRTLTFTIANGGSRNWNLASDAATLPVGTVRGTISLNGNVMTPDVFEESCIGTADLLPVGDELTCIISDAQLRSDATDENPNELTLEFESVERDDRVFFTC